MDFEAGGRKTRKEKESVERIKHCHPVCITWQEQSSCELNRILPSAKHDNWFEWEFLGPTWNSTEQQCHNPKQQTHRVKLPLTFLSVITQSRRLWRKPRLFPHHTAVPVWPPRGRPTRHGPRTPCPERDKAQRVPFTGVRQQAAL